MNLQDEIIQFKKFSLKKVETQYTTPSGKSYLLDNIYNDSLFSTNTYTEALPFIVDTKPDLQVAKILPYLYLGSVDVASDKELLDDLKITHIVDATTMKIENFPDSFAYKHMNIMDLEQQNLLPHIYDFIKYVKEVNSVNENVDGINTRILVHCMAGISRCVSLVCGYLILEMGFSYDDAFRYIKERRPFAKPNVGFTNQLKCLHR